MADRASRTVDPTETSGKARRKVADWLDRGVSAYQKAIDESTRSWRLAAYTAQAWLKGELLPAVGSVAEIQRTLASSVTRAVRGDQGLAAWLGETSERIDAGLRYARLVNTAGKRVFGSATFEGERVLATTARYRLSVLPPTGAPTGLAIFHAGGAIPYGDRIFRFTPDYNFYDRFLERGVTVYAMELHGDRRTNDIGRMTVADLVADLVELSEVAFADHGARMVLEGYCGHGTQALAYVLTRPEDADRKFHTLATFVAPIDGKRCKLIAESVAVTPASMTLVQRRLWGLFGGYVPGDATRIGLDTALGTLFYKTLLGYFSAGFHKPSLAGVRSDDALDPRELRDLAGAYWISPDCGRRFPVPVDVARFTTALFADGVAPTGDTTATLAADGRGEPLSLRTLAERTSLRVVGFYGGLDEVVPDTTAHVLISLLGKRYRHVVHPQAGHISYVLSPKLWAPGSPYGLDPNPVDVLLELASPTPAPPEAP